MTRPSLPLWPGILAQGFSLVAWQSGLIVQKLLVADSNIGSLMLVQLSGAAIVMWLFLILSDSLPRPSQRTAINIAWGLLAPGLVFALGIAGAARTDGASVALIWGLFPLVAPIIARLLIGEPVHRSIIAGALVTLVGVVLLTMVRARGGTSDPLGNLLVFASVTTAAVNAVIGRVMNRGSAPWYQVATLQVTGAVFAAAVLTTVLGWKPPAIQHTGQAMALAYLILFMTVGNFFAYNLALTRIPVAWIALGAALSPIIGLVTARIILATPIGVTDLCFAALIVGGVCLPVIWSMLRRRQADVSRMPQPNR